MPKLKIFPREPSFDGKFRLRCVSAPIPLPKNASIPKNYFKTFTDMRSRRSSSSASSAQPPFMISAFGTDLGSIESIPSFRRNFYIKEEVNSSYNCLTKFSCILALFVALIIVCLSALALKDILLQQFVSQKEEEKLKIKNILQPNNTGNTTI
uniref:Uncharacterized protein n=1 Tax=Meloidogyne enterolobii TaxID=390850 RepID=A0A6V7U0J1_MELEN|nr:unnamed protein product [Meloidogyne enterolobii]